MSPSISWIDRGEFAALFRRMQNPAAAPARPVADAPRNAPVVPSPQQVLSETQAAKVLPAAASPAASAQVPRPRPAAPVQPAPYEAPEGSLGVRAEALLSWIDREIECEATFVTDEHGLAVVERQAEPEILAASAALMTSVREIRSIAPEVQAHVTLTMGHDRLMSFVLADSDWGQLGAGIVSRERPAEHVLVALSAAVRATFAKNGSQP